MVFESWGMKKKLGKGGKQFNILKNVFLSHLLNKDYFVVHFLKITDDRIHTFYTSGS